LRFIGDGDSGGFAGGFCASAAPPMTSPMIARMMDFLSNDPSHYSHGRDHPPDAALQEQ
jgi:hypothetical protein